LVEAPGQGHLFEFDIPENITASPESPAREPRAFTRERSRKPAYERLPQVHDVPEAAKVCAHCGEAKARIGEDEARVLEFEPRACLHDVSCSFRWTRVRRCRPDYCRTVGPSSTRSVF
jgi:hypothetical protein